MEGSFLMKKSYKLTIEVRQRGELLRTETLITDPLPSFNKPRVGEGTALLVDPPIYKTIIKVEEMLDETYEGHGNGD